MSEADVSTTCGKRREVGHPHHRRTLYRRVTTWLAEGKGPVLVQRAMGHAQLATTMGYLHLLDDDLAQLVADDEERALQELATG